MANRILKPTLKRQQIRLDPEDVKIVEEKQAENGNSSQTAAVRAIIREWKRWDTEIKQGQLVRAK